MTKQQQAIAQAIRKQADGAREFGATTAYGYLVAAAADIADVLYPAESQYRQRGEFMTAVGFFDVHAEE